MCVHAYDWVLLVFETCIYTGFKEKLAEEWRHVSQGEGCLFMQVSAVPTNFSHGHYLHYVHTQYHSTVTFITCPVLEHFHKPLGPLPIAR